jgi:two-component system OmpR family response regulator
VDVATGRVLIIEADEWVSALLAKFLTEAGHDVQVAAEAREGLERALQLAPECIIADVRLPDIDGFWVARRLRAEAPELASAPFLFLTDIDDPDERLPCLLVGSDLYLTKPPRQADVVTQVGALVGMVQRLRRQDAVSLPAHANAAPSFSGDISLLSVPTLLSMLEMERRTGMVRVCTDGQEASIELCDGGVHRVTLAGSERDPVEGLREVLRWTKGAFAFSPGQVPASAGVGRSVGALLLEAMQREDESAQG